MWVLAFCLVKITWDIWWEDRIAEPNTLRLAIRFLFAFPALRFTQPGLPVSLSKNETRLSESDHFC